MSYFVRTLEDDEPNLPLERFAAVLGQLEVAEEQHGRVALAHESGWTLSYRCNRTLILEDVESNDPDTRFHQSNVSPANVERLWRLLAVGAIDLLKREPWLPGYG